MHKTTPQKIVNEYFSQDPNLFPPVCCVECNSIIPQYDDLFTCPLRTEASEHPSGYDLCLNCAVSVARKCS